MVGLGDLCLLVHIWSKIKINSWFTAFIKVLSYGSGADPEIQIEMAEEIDKPPPHQTIINIEKICS